MQDTRNKRIKSIAIIAAVILGIIALSFGLSKFIFRVPAENMVMSFNEYRVQTNEISFSPKDESLNADDYTGGEVKVEIDPDILEAANAGKTGDALMTVQYQITELDSQTGVDENNWIDYTGPFFVDHNVKIYSRLVSEIDENFKGPVTSKDVTQIAVAKIGTTTYKTLAEAITAWSDLSEQEKETAKIEMVANTAESVTIPASQNIKIDLKGYTITGETSTINEQTEEVIKQTATAITVNGKLNLIDSGRTVTENGNNVTKYGSVTSDGANTVVVSGSIAELTIGKNDGSVTVNGPVINGGTSSDENVNYDGVLVEEGGKINFYDGKVTAPSKTGTHTAIKVNGTPVGEENIDLVKTPEGYRLDISVDQESGREVDTLVKIYKVTFDSNHGTPDNISDIEVATGKAYGTYTKGVWPVDADMHRDGYTFAGWKYGANLITAASIVTENKDHTLTADWTANTYNITYNLNKGILPQGKSNPATYTPEVETFTLINPTRTGYTFKGWKETTLNTQNVTETITKGTWGDREYEAIWADETAPTNKAPTATSTTSTITVSCNQKDDGSGIDDTKPGNVQ